MLFVANFPIVVYFILTARKGKFNEEANEVSHSFKCLPFESVTFSFPPLRFPTYGTFVKIPR